MNPQNLYDRFVKNNKEDLDKVIANYFNFLNSTDVDRERVNWAIDQLKEFK